MNNKNEVKQLSENINSINTLNPLNKVLLNPDIKQDLLFFKNDVLKDIRKLEEKINLRINEQNLLNSVQHSEYDKKFEQMSSQINQANSWLSDNLNLVEKIKQIQTFKSKAEDNYNRLSVKINSIQKEVKDYINNIEKMINDNLRYPGVIGSNARFSDFRRFIDYIIRTFRDINEFKDAMAELNFNEFKKKVNTDIQEIRLTLNSNSKYILTLLGKDKAELSRLENLINQNKKSINEIKEKEENKYNMYLSETQTIITTLEKNINDKYDEQNNEIENLKKSKNQIILDINDMKSDIETNKKNIESRDLESEKNFIMKIINENYIPFNQRNFDENQNISNNKILFSKKQSQFPFNIQAGKGTNSFFHKDLLLNSNNNEISDLPENINIINKSRYIEEMKNNSENIIDNYNPGMNNIQRIEKSRSYEKLPNPMNLRYLIDDNNDMRKIDSKGIFELTNEEILNNKDRINVHNYKFRNESEKNKYLSVNKKDNRNNYSVADIANVKIKKVVLPETIYNRNTKNIMQMPKSSLSENRGLQLLSNTKSSFTTKKYLFKNCDNFNKSSFDFKKTNKQTTEKIKSIKLVESARNVNKKNILKNNENLNSLLLMKIKPNKVFNTLDQIKKGQKRNLSFEKDETKKDEKVQIGLGKTFYDKNKIRELILINPKNYKRNRKIKL